MLMMMRADDSYSPSTTEGCTAEELLACITADDYDACIAACSDSEEPEEPTNPGYAKVTTKAAADQTVALNAVEKKIGTVTLTAGDNDTTVTAIEITKAGLGDANDILSIQLMKNGEYVSTQSNGLTSKRTATLRFTPKLEIKAGKSETFDVVVSLNGTNANGKHDFSVTAVTVANGTFGGTPAKLGSLTTTNYEVSDVAVKLTAGYTLSAGDENVELVKVEITPEVEALVSAVTIDSTVDELNKKFANVKAYIDDEVVGNVSVNDETFTVDGLNETVKKGKKLELTLKGDVIYVGENIVAPNNIVLSVKSNHVNATETNTNERMTSTDKTTTPATIDIKGVDLTLTNLEKKDQTVAPATTDVVLMDLELTAGSDLEIQEFTLTAKSFQNKQFEEGKVTLYVDGIDYDINGTRNFNGDKNYYFSVNAGEKISIQVVGDLLDEDDLVATGLTSWTTSQFEFEVTQVKNLESNNVIKNITGKKKEGHKTSVKTGKPTLKDTKVNSSSLLKEGEESDVLGFSVKANNEQITLKSLTFNVSNTGIVEEIALYKEGSSSALVTVDELSGNNVTMTLSQSVKADATEKYVLKAKMDDGDVTALGVPVTFELNDVKYVTASNSTQTSINPAISAKYQLASDEPTFTLTKNGNRIEVVATNTSDYDIDGVALAVKVMGKFVDGENLLQKALAGNTWLIKDHNNNTVATATATFVPAKNLVQIEYPLSIEANDSETFVIEMPESATIESEYYTAEERVFGFRYVDTDGNTSVAIIARYNGADANELTASMPSAISTVVATAPAAATLVGGVDVDNLQTGITIDNYKVKGTIKKANPGDDVYTVLGMPAEYDHFIALIIDEDPSNGSTPLECSNTSVYDTISSSYIPVDTTDCTIVWAVNSSSILKIKKGDIIDSYSFDEATFN